MYELVIIWSTGEKEIVICKDEAECERAAANMRMAFGAQVAWTGSRPRTTERR